MRTLLAVLAVILLLAACDPGDETEVDQAQVDDPTDDLEELDEETDEEVEDPGPGVDDPVEEPASAGAAALTWLEAVRDTDTERAWALLGDQSQEAVGSPEELEPLLPERAEGMGAFADVEFPTVRATSVGDEVLWIVVLSGEVEREGMTEEDAIALAVIQEEGLYRVEAFAAPDDLPSFSGDAGELTITVPAGSTSFVYVNGTLTEASSSELNGDTEELVLTDVAGTEVAVVFEGDGGTGAGATLLDAPPEDAADDEEAGEGTEDGEEDEGDDEEEDEDA